MPKRNPDIFLSTCHVQCQLSQTRWAWCHLSCNNSDTDSGYRCKTALSVLKMATLLIKIISQLVWWLSVAWVNAVPRMRIHSWHCLINLCPNSHFQYLTTGQTLPDINVSKCTVKNNGHITRHNHGDEASVSFFRHFSNKGTKFWRIRVSMVHSCYSVTWYLYITDQFQRIISF